MKKILLASLILSVLVLVSPVMAEVTTCNTFYPINDTSIEACQNSNKNYYTDAWSCIDSSISNSFAIILDSFE